jgi:hypothetical protein
LTTELPFSSHLEYPSAVVEAPSVGAAEIIATMPPWTPVVCSDLQVRVGAAWVPAASLPAVRITMQTPHAQRAAPGLMDGASGFSVALQGATTS